MIARVIIFTTGGIIARPTLTRDYAARATIVRARGGHRVFLIVTAWLTGQNALAVAKGLPVLAMRETGALLYHADHALRLFGQGRVVYGR